MMGRVLRLPGLVMNIESVGGGLVKGVYGEVVRVLPEMGREMQKGVLETMVLLGHTEMIVTEKGIHGEIGRAHV